jgi:hypothetical protein
MKLRNLATSALVFASVVLSAGIASAQPTQSRGMNDNYLGAGIAAGVTNGGQENDAALLGGNIQGRFAVVGEPISLRGSVLYGGDAVAAMPMLTYDAPIAKDTNLYIGGGYSFITEEGQSTQLGNKNAPVVTIGAERKVANNIVVYGDAKWGINAYENSPADAVSIQTGVGLTF